MSCEHIILTMHSRAIFPLVIIILLQFLVLSSGESEADLLLKFKASISNTAALSSWNNSIPPCNGDVGNWVGLMCQKGTVWGIQLQSMGLEGVIDVDSLSKMPNLRTMSFMNNNFDGSLPNLSVLVNMKSIYLSNNKFSGEISPNTFDGMISLKKLHLAYNQFTGPIPVTLVALPRLVELMLENNQFQGEIPPFLVMKNLNVSNNALTGQIPTTLAQLSPDSFQGGNKDLCGAPLPSCTAPQKLSLASIIILSIIVPTAVAALIVVAIVLSRRKPAPDQPEVAAAAAAAEANGQSKHGGDLDKMEQGQAASGSPAAEKSHHRKKSEPNVKITFLKEDREPFDMTDLLKASAEILGSGVFGSTYKAALNDRQVMVVKRFRQMNNVNKQEFHEHMNRLGRLNHPNVLPIVGFYYRKEEKLLVTDFVERASLASHLHGNRSRGRSCPNWPTRLKIIKGVAKGLLYLYNELPSITTPHGHLKSPNVLLDASFNPILTDYGLVPVVNQEHAQEHMVSYKCPEYKCNGRITKKTDIWSFGILILEILTGRFPSNFLQQGKDNNNDTDIASWVESVVNDEENNVDVFDADMDRDKQSEGELMKLLKIGFSCCQVDVDMRPDIREVVEKIEEIKEC